jgi:hypothetical protein
MSPFPFDLSHLVIQPIRDKSEGEAHKTDAAGKKKKGGGAHKPIQLPRQKE